MLILKERIGLMDTSKNNAAIVQRLRDEIKFIEEELDSDDPDLWNPDYARYTLQVLKEILNERDN